MTDMELLHLIHQGPGRDQCRFYRIPGVHQGLPNAATGDGNKRHIHFLLFFTSSLTRSRTLQNIPSLVSRLVSAMPVVSSRQELGRDAKCLFISFCLLDRKLLFSVVVRSVACIFNGSVCDMSV